MIRDCVAPSGGAILVQDSNLTIAQSNLTDNIAAETTGGALQVLALPSNGFLNAHVAKSVILRMSTQRLTSRVPSCHITLQTFRAKHRVLCTRSS
jgi:hypothetical protein